MIDRARQGFDNSRQMFNIKGMKSLNVTNTLANLLIKYVKLKGGAQHTDLLRELESYQSTDVLSYQQWCGYLADLTKLGSSPQLGIELGELAQAEHGGILAYLVSSCDTLGDALIHFERFQTLLYGGEGRIESVADKILIRWQSDVIPSLGTQLSDEVLIIGLTCFIKRLIGQELDLPKIGFIHAKPSYSSAYEEYLGNTVSYGGTELTVEFPKRYLALPIKNPEPVLKSILEQQAEVLLQQSSAVSDSRIESGIKSGIKSGIESDVNQRIKKELVSCINESNMTLESLSSKLNISSRTLHRRLQQQGTNFNQLLRDTRLELAIGYLENGSFSLSEISHLLGYTEQSAFSRAFKQWTGKAPKYYINKSTLGT